MDRFSVNLSLLLVRLIVGTIFMAHGSQKVFGWFGGAGLVATAEKMGMGPIGYLVSIGECFGGLGIALGFLTRFSAASNLLIMLGAIALVHGKNGFFAPAGFEYNLALIGLLLPVMLAGPGPYSLGRFLPLPKRADGEAPVLVLE